MLCIYMYINNNINLLKYDGIFCLLFRALFTIPGNTPMFWQKISSKVATRSAEQCQWKHQGKEIASNKTLLAPKRVPAKEMKDTGSKGDSLFEGLVITDSCTESDY